MKVLVTGIGGFIGSHLGQRLINDGHEVTGIDDLSAGYAENIPEGTQFYKGYVEDIGLWAFKGVDVVFHLAASKKNICLRSPLRDLNVNAGGTLHLLQQCKKAGVKKFIHFSTGSVIGESKEPVTEESPCRPVSYYGVSKLAGENYARMYGKEMDVTVIRPHHVYGARQESDPQLGGVIAIWKKQIDEGKPIQIHGDGSQERLFTHVSALVDASINAWERDIVGTFNIATSEKTTIAELAQLMGAKNIQHVEGLEGDIHTFNVDNTKSRELGVEYIPLKEGLKLL